MFGERQPKMEKTPPHLTDEELERIRLANSEADPTTVSPIPLSGPLSHAADLDYRGRPFTVGVHETGNYVELRHKPAAQQFIALLAKGIVPVSDIVAQDEAPEKRYSKMMPLERIQLETSEEQLHAYFTFMRLVFGDLDHRQFGTRQHNFVHKDNKAVLYDFGEFDLGSPHTTIPHRRSETYSEPVLTHLSELLHDFEQRITGEEGLDFIRAALAHAHAEPSHILQAPSLRDAEDVQEVLVSRVQRAQLIVANARNDVQEQEGVK